MDQPSAWQLAADYQLTHQPGAATACKAEAHPTEAACGKGVLICILPVQKHLVHLVVIVVLYSSMLFLEPRVSLCALLVHEALDTGVCIGWPLKYAVHLPMY